MEYIYRMSREMYQETVVDAKKCGATIEKYVTETFGLRRKCIKVEIA